jgi:hypothetical protein
MVELGESILWETIPAGCAFEEMDKKALDTGSSHDFFKKF